MGLIYSMPWRFKWPSEKAFTFPVFVAIECGTSLLGKELVSQLLQDLGFWILCEILPAGRVFLQVVELFAPVLVVDIAMPV